MYKKTKQFFLKTVQIFMLAMVRGVFALAYLLGPERSSNFGAWLTRTIGPLLPVHKVALKNLKAAYPEKTPDDIKAVAIASWDNLGRVGAEYPHLAKLFDYNPEAETTGRIEVEGIEHFLALRDDNKPALIFSAHLANWELPAICAARFELDATAVFRAPNDPAIAKIIQEIRGQTMGGLEAARQGAAFAMQGVLERGGHLGMLVDQHFTRGVKVNFFGRPALANATLAKFARHFECPVHGVRVIRLANYRFRLELTPALTLPRDESDNIIIQASMQMMTDIVEGWIREHPEQWLWMHRRWRI